MWKSARDSQQTLPHFSWSNLKCFSINESHCIERWSSEQRSFVVASFFATTSVHLLFTDLVPPFLASMEPRWFEAFPYFQNLLNYSFVFACTISAQNACQKWTFATGYISLSPFRWSKIQTSFGLFCPPDIVNFRLKSLFVITLVLSKQI